MKPKYERTPITNLLSSQELVRRLMGKTTMIRELEAAKSSSYDWMVFESVCPPIQRELGITIWPEAWWFAEREASSQCELVIGPLVVGPMPVAPSQALIPAEFSYARFKQAFFASAAKDQEDFELIDEQEAVEDFELIEKDEIRNQKSM